MLGNIHRNENIFVKENKIFWTHSGPEKVIISKAVRGSIVNKQVRIILVYMSVETKSEDKERNEKIKREIDEKLEENQDTAIMLLGDFNGHVGFLGRQKVDRNGRFATEMMNNNKTILLNCDDKCDGIYTWESKEYRSAIDYVLVNSKMYQSVHKMTIDEHQEHLDLSDHNVITVF